MEEFDWQEFQQEIRSSWRDLDLEELFEGVPPDALQNNINSAESLLETLIEDSVTSRDNRVAAMNAISCIAMVLKLRPESSWRERLSTFLVFPEKSVRTYAKMTTWRFQQWNLPEEEGYASEAVLDRLRNIDFLNRNTLENDVIQRLVNSVGALIEANHLRDAQRELVRLDLKFNRLAAAGHETSA